MIKKITHQLLCHLATLDIIDLPIEDDPEDEIQSLEIEFNALNFI